MVYRNTETGAEINTACAVSGKNWEAVTPPPSKPAGNKTPAKKQVRKNG